MSFTGGGLEHFHRQRADTPRIDRAIERGRLWKGMHVADDRGRKDPTIDRPKANGVEAVAIELVKQVRVAEQVFVAALDSCGFSLFGDIEGRGLGGGDLEPREQFQESDTVRLLRADVQPLRLQCPVDLPGEVFRERRRIADNLINQRPGVLIFAGA
jgi:hypothetical protein